MDQNTNLQLMEYRNSIDNIDAALVFLLSERFKITQKVGILKAKKTLPAADKSREAKQVARLRELAQEAELDPALIEQITLTRKTCLISVNFRNLIDGSNTLQQSTRSG